MREASGEAENGEEPFAAPGEEMSLTDFTQVAMQMGVSMLHLNDLQAKYRFIDMWRQKLVNKLLE